MSGFFFCGMVFWQTVQVLIKFSSVLVTPNHHTAVAILDRHFWNPWCPWCIFSKVSICLASETTILDPNRSKPSFTVRLARNYQYFLRLPLSIFLFGQLESQNSVSFEQIGSSFWTVRYESRLSFVAGRATIIYWQIFQCQKSSPL